MESQTAARQALNLADRFESPLTLSYIKSNVTPELSTSNNNG